MGIALAEQLDCEIYRADLCRCLGMATSAGAIVRGNAMNSPVLRPPCRYRLGPAAPPMNHVGIDAGWHGDRGYRCTGLGALRHHLRLLHRAVAPLRVRHLACHRVHLNLDAYDPCRLAARNQGELAGDIPRCHRAFFT